MITTLLYGLLVFLVGSLVVAILIYIVHLIVGMLELPPQVKQIALTIFALILLVCLIMLAIYAATSGVPWLPPPRA